MAFFFGVPAIFFVLSHALVLAGLITPPPHMQAHFQNLDVIDLAINGTEAVFLTICMGSLLAMKKYSFPLIAVYFSIDTLHNFSGKYLSEAPTPSSLAITVLVSAAVVTYVWNLRRKGVLN